MKCEHCGKNEVTFVYRSNINGTVEEHHLCSQCAEKLGYTQRIQASGRSLMQNFFGGNGLFGESWFGGSFAPMSNWMGRMLEDPFDDFFAEMPALSASPARQVQETRQEQELVGKEEQSRFSYLRQLNALKMEMRKAVHQENFERAAELRDQIRQLETDHKEQKEQRKGQ